MTYRYVHKELVFKFPDNKLPYIGVQFDDLVLGAELNAGWVEDFKNEDWQVKLELERQNISLVLLCPEKNLYCRHDVILKDGRHLFTLFTEATKKVEYFNFGHCCKIDGKVLPLRTPRFKPWVLKCSIFNIYNIY